MLGAILLIGAKPLYLSLLPKIRDIDEAVLGKFLTFVGAYEKGVAFPSVMTIVLTGALMTWGPFGAWSVLSPAGHFIVAGIVLWLVVHYLMAFVFKDTLITAIGQCQDGGTLSAPIWSKMRNVLVAGTVVEVAIVFFMVTKPMI